jgi:hypothetical protein
MSAGRVRVGRRARAGSVAPFLAVAQPVPVADPARAQMQDLTELVLRVLATEPRMSVAQLANDTGASASELIAGLLALRTSAARRA